MQAVFRLQVQEGLVSLNECMSFYRSGVDEERARIRAEMMLENIQRALKPQRTKVVGVATAAPSVQEAPAPKPEKKERKKGK